MGITNQSKVPYKEIDMEGSEKVQFKVLVDGPNFVLRQFRIKKDSHTPLHKHPWEHEIYILKGKGIVVIGDEEHQVNP